MLNITGIWPWESVRYRFKIFLKNKDKIRFYRSSSLQNQKHKNIWASHVKHIRLERSSLARYTKTFCTIKKALPANNNYKSRDIWGHLISSYEKVKLLGIETKMLNTVFCLHKVKLLQTFHCWKCFCARIRLFKNFCW